MSTIQDVARLAGVSPTTAKRALREPAKLNPETLARVQRAIEQLHYETDQRAGSLRGGQSSTVGLIVGNVLEPFFAHFARTCARVLAEEGYTLIISENEYSAARELDELRRLYGQRVSGIILRPGYGNESRDYLARLASRGVSIVEYDYLPPHSSYPAVMLDNAGAMREAVVHLHALGHRCIAALGTYDPVVLSEERSRAFPEVMNSLGLVVPPEYRRVTALNEDTAYTLTHELLALPNPPTALIALTGMQAIGAYRAIRERGLGIPDDLSLVTFDNYTWTALVDPPITVVEQPVEAMATATAQRLITLLGGTGTGQETAPQVQVFPARMVLRGSTSPPRVLAT
ncbi:LacI family DNA-binding transcriptional regulator [Deinococcus hopiensis]|uniref:LacI family DNA-binding transcriptional regulator n=1 Tax=Deinococcus hopiensis TaxID=309885 RepID=UPI000A037512|nr:LacI family DNA-binding transcriptional regulator [Deinococcus hopiensis]